MSPRSAFRLIIELPVQSMDLVLREAVAPLTRELRGDERLGVVYFHRYVKPVWNITVAFLGGGDGFESTVRQRAERHLAPLADRGALGTWRWSEPEPDTDGIAGASCRAEIAKLLHHDSAACLDLLDCEESGRTSRSRREYSLVMTERTLDLLEFDREARLAFYRLGHRRPFDQGTWGDEDRPLLEERYEGWKDRLARLLDPRAAGAETTWGGSEPATIAARCLSASRPHLEALQRAHAKGILSTGIVAVAHDLCQRHGNRLGIDGLGEAVLRYLVFRLHDEGRLELR